MRYKKAKIIAIVLLGFGLSGINAQSNIYLKETSGKQTAYSLNNIKKMSFLSGNMIISKFDSNSDVYLISGLRYLNFTDLSTVIIPLAEKPKGTIMVYPNPVVDLLNILISTTENQAGVIEIINIEGKVVYIEKINSLTNVNQINISALPKGIYLCKINYQRTSGTIKFFKQ